MKKPELPFIKQLFKIQDKYRMRDKKRTYKAKGVIEDLIIPDCKSQSYRVLVLKTDLGDSLYFKVNNAIKFKKANSTAFPYKIEILKERDFLKKTIIKVGKDEKVEIIFKISNDDSFYVENKEGKEIYHPYLCFVDILT